MIYRPITPVANARLEREENEQKQGQSLEQDVEEEFVECIEAQLDAALREEAR